MAISAFAFRIQPFLGTHTMYYIRQWVECGGAFLPEFGNDEMPQSLLDMPFTELTCEQWDHLKNKPIKAKLRGKSAIRNSQIKNLKDTEF